MKVPYSDDYYPPAPVLMVGLALIDESPRLEELRALVDSGADGTFVPVALLEQLDAPAIYTANVRSHLGERWQQVAVHRVDLILGNVRLPGIEVVSDDWGDQVILGRNVLNRLRITLDGPARATVID